VASDDVDVAAQLANVPDAVSADDSDTTDSSDTTRTPDTTGTHGRSSSPVDSVLDPGLAVAAEPDGSAPVRSSSRARRARQRAAGTGAAVAATAAASSTDTESTGTDTTGTDTDTTGTESNGTESNGTESNGTGSTAPPEGTAAAADTASAATTEAETDVVESHGVDDDEIGTEVLPVTGDEQVEEQSEAAVVEEQVEAAVVEEADLPDTEAVPAVTATGAPEALVETELLPQVETEILPQVEPRIYDVETDEPGAYVSLVPAVTEPAALPAEVEDEPTAPVVVRRRRRRPRVRRVTRVIRHVDTWTVFKVVLLFNIVLYAATLISGVLLWNVAHGTGTVGNVERFMESFGWESFEFNGQEIFDNGWRIGMFVALGLTGLAVLAATTFNLITDIVGGIRVTVLEEEVVVAAPEMPRKPAGVPPVEA
jgi:hypothetical protein